MLAMELDDLLMGNLTLKFKVCQYFVRMARTTAVKFWLNKFASCSITWLNSNEHLANCFYIVSWSTVVLYIGMAPKKMAAPLYVYKAICSQLCPRFSHKLLRTIPDILECFHQQQDS